MLKENSELQTKLDEAEEELRKYNRTYGSVNNQHSEQLAILKNDFN